MRHTHTQTNIHIYAHTNLCIFSAVVEALQIAAIKTATLHATLTMRKYHTTTMKEVIKVALSILELTCRVFMFQSLLCFVLSIVWQLLNLFQLASLLIFSRALTSLL